MLVYCCGLMQGLANKLGHSKPCYRGSAVSMVLCLGIRTNPALEL